MNVLEEDMVIWKDYHHQNVQDYVQQDIIVLLLLLILLLMIVVVLINIVLKDLSIHSLFPLICAPILSMFRSITDLIFIIPLLVKSV